MDAIRMATMRLLPAFVVAALAAIGGMRAHAQGGPGEIRGSITAADGSPLANVAIEVRKLARQPPDRARSGPDGSFRVSDLGEGAPA
jgi:hypothetical protein